MPENSQNYVLGIKTPADTSGLDQAAAGIARIRTEAGKPISGPRVLPDVTDATAVVAKLRQQIGQPVSGIKLAFDTAGADRAVERIRQSLKAAGDNVTAIRAKLATDIGPINGPAVKPRFNPREQAIRDNQAGIVRGIRLRDEATRQADDRASIQKEANDRVFGAKTPIVSTRPAFSDQEKQIRAIQAQIIGEMRRQQQAAKQTADEMEARRRLFGEGPTANQSLASLADDLKVSSKPEPPKKPITLDEAKSRRAAKRAGTDFSDLEQEAAASRKRIQKRINDLAIAGDEPRRDALLRDPRYNGGRNAGGPGGRPPVGPGGGSGGGGGGRRERDGPIGGFLKTEDKLNLGNGTKIVGEFAKVAGVSLAVVGAAGALGEAMKNYRERIAAGASTEDALILATKGVAEKIPFIGELVGGLDTLAKEVSFDRNGKFGGEANKERRRAEEDQRAADADRVAKAGEAQREQGRAVVDPLREAAIRGGESNAEAGIAAADTTGVESKRAQASSSYADTTRALDKQAEELKKNQAGADVSKHLNSDDYSAAQKSIDQQRAQAFQKMQEELNQADLAQRKANEQQIFDTRQKYLASEGQTLNASLEALDHANAQQLEQAKQLLDAVGKAYGTNSSQYANAKNTYDSTVDAANKNRDIDKSVVVKQANQDARASIVQGFKEQAGVGNDVTSAQLAVQIAIEDEAKLRKNRLEAIVRENGIDADTKARAQEQLKNLANVTAEQVQQAKDAIVQEERNRQSGQATTLEGYKAQQLRDEGRRTGDGNKTREAAQIDTFESYRQKYEQLHAIETDPKATKAEKETAAGFLKTLPGEFSQAIKEAGFEKVTSRDLADNTYAKAQDAGSTTGFGQAIRENFLAAGTSDAAKTAENTKKLVDLLTKLVSGNTSPDQFLSLFASN